MNALWIGLAFILVGVGLVFIHLVNASESVDVEGGGVVMIGPLPLLFGSSDRYALFALVLGVFTLILLYIMLFLK